MARRMTVAGAMRKIARLERKIKKLERRRFFIASKTTDGDVFVCDDCMTKTERKSLGDDDVQVWEEYSEGWTGPCICSRCNLSIPVYVDGGKLPENWGALDDEQGRIARS